MESNIKWVLTDPSEGVRQYGRKLSETQYEFKDEVTPARVIDLTKFDEDYKEIIINHYGYTLEPSSEHNQNIKELYPDNWEWIIAECIFEMEQ